MTQLTTEQIEAENEEIRKIEEEEAIEDLNELKQDMIERHADFLTPHDVSKIFLRRVKKDKDAVIALTGDEGEGKSTLALHIIQETLRLHHKTEEEILETINDYVIYSPNKEEVKKRIIGLPKYMPVSADEAIKILYKLNWGTEIQKYLNMLYAICRKENKITILCMPRFIDFNEFFRNHRIKFWIHILERGRAVMFSKDWSPFSKDPWWLDENQKIIKDRKSVV